MEDPAGRPCGSESGDVVRSEGAVDPRRSARRDRGNQRPVGLGLPRREHDLPEADLSRDANDLRKVGRLPARVDLLQPAVHRLDLEDEFGRELPCSTKFLRSPQIGAREYRLLCTGDEDVDRLVRLPYPRVDPERHVPRELLDIVELGIVPFEAVEVDEVEPGKVRRETVDDVEDIELPAGSPTCGHRAVRARQADLSPADEEAWDEFWALPRRRRDRVNGAARGGGAHGHRTPRGFFPLPFGSGGYLGRSRLPPVARRWRAADGGPSRQRPAAEESPHFGEHGVGWEPDGRESELRSRNDTARWYGEGGAPEVPSGYGETAASPEASPDRRCEVFP